MTSTLERLPLSSNLFYYFNKTLIYFYSVVLKGIKQSLNWVLKLSHAGLRGLINLNFNSFYQLLCLWWLSGIVCINMLSVLLFFSVKAVCCWLLMWLVVGC